jgi:hypothetical protein
VGGLQNRILAILALAAAFIAIVYAVYTFLPVGANATPDTWGFGVDWKGCIRPDTLKLVNGQSPYVDGCGLNPPWTYLVLAPLALLPAPLGTAILFTLTYFVYVGAMFRAGARPWMALAVVLSRFVFVNALNGNIDWLPVIGFFLPAQIGLFFVLMKPQIGVGIALFWLVEAWRAGRMKEVARVFAPVTLAYIASFALFGFWPVKMGVSLVDSYNASLWPYGLIAGVPLLVYAILKRLKFVAVAATPFLAPYVNIHSYAVGLFALIPYPVGFVLMVAMSWLIR